MKRRTQGKEAEINAKLPFVRDLVRNGQRAMKAGQSDLALAYYSAAQEQIPILFSIGMKAARIARRKFRLHFAQILADKVSSESYLCDYWNLKARKLSIECMIRRMTPWLDYGLAPQVVFSFMGEGGYASVRQNMSWRVRLTRFATTPNGWSVLFRTCVHTMSGSVANTPRAFLSTSRSKGR